jgi:uncharacterized membrane protein
MSARLALAGALLALAALYAAWYHHAGVTTLAVFVLPPLALALLLRARPRAASFWSGVLALLWFSHGVMVAWSRDPERGYALVEIALALAVVFAANFAALRARFGKRQTHAP